MLNETFKNALHNIHVFVAFIEGPNKACSLLELKHVASKVSEMG